MAHQKHTCHKKRRAHTEASEDMPTMRIGLIDLSVIDGAVMGYLAYLRQAVPPSRKRDRRIRLLQDVHLRLSPVLDQNTQTDTPIPLTGWEIQALNFALAGFAKLVRRTIPVSQERDETLRRFELLRQQLAIQLSPTSGSTERN